MTINDVIEAAPPESQPGLRWFAEKAEQVVPWQTELEDGTRLFSTPKGIYKPAGSDFALSVRQTLKSPYPDREPQYRSDGGWTYMYHQEGTSPADDAYFTNAALRRCMEAGVPVGVARQKTARPGSTTYEILGIARVTDWKNGFFQLDGYARDGTVFSQPVDGPFADDLRSDEAEPGFDPATQKDAREKQLRAIVRRRGQRAFRAMLIRIYGGKCAISGSSVEAVLEAAHITPYLGPDTNKAGNGILLRSDLHTLWDLGLLAIDPDAGTVWMSPRLEGSEYWSLRGGSPFVPRDAAERPSVDALQAQWDLAHDGLA